MHFLNFEYIFSKPRLRRYVNATKNDTRRAMTLYRKNISLSQELFAVISCFEIALRNKIDEHYSRIHGKNWILNSVSGIFATEKCVKSRKKIQEKIKGLGKDCEHDKLIAELEFGFWRYLFAPAEFAAGGTSLLKIFQEIKK